MSDVVVLVGRGDRVGPLFSYVEDASLVLPWLVGGPLTLELCAYLEQLAVRRAMHPGLVAASIFADLDTVEPTERAAALAPFTAPIGYDDEALGEFTAADVHVADTVGYQL